MDFVDREKCTCVQFSKQIITKIFLKCLESTNNTMIIVMIIMIIRKIRYFIILNKGAMLCRRRRQVHHFSNNFWWYFVLWARFELLSLTLLFTCISCGRWYRCACWCWNECCCKIWKWRSVWGNQCSEKKTTNDNFDITLMSQKMDSIFSQWSQKDNSTKKSLKTTRMKKSLIVLGLRQWYIQSRI